MASDVFRAVTDHLRAWEGQAFAWGAADCCAFAADYVRRLGAPDPYAEYEGAYASALSAARALRQRGHACVGDALDAVFPRVEAPLFGDLAAFGEGIRQAVGVSLGGDEVAFVDGRFVIDAPLIGWRPCLR